ncbi:MAG: glycosyltransferase family 4 protein [Patescibacteria group bacterium]
MNIAHIGGHGVSEEVGTQEEYILQQATHLVRLGHRVFVYGTQESTTDLFNGIHLQHFNSPFKGWFHCSLHAIVSACHAAIFLRADIVHLHGAIAGLAVPFLKLLRPSAIIFVTFHEPDIQHVKGLIPRLAMNLGERFAIRSSAELFCTKQALQNDIILRYSRKAELVAHGVSVKRVSNDDISLKPLGLKSYGYIAMLAPMTGESGVFTLIDAWQKARAERPDLFLNLKLALVSTEKGGELDLDAYLDESIVVTNFQNREVLQALYAGARFIVLPSFYSAHPANILTALSYGKAVIASSFGEYSAILGDQAVLFEPGNADELALCLLQLAEDQTLTASLGHSARSFVEVEYCWEILAREIEDEYKKHRALREGLLAIR